MALVSLILAGLFEIVWASAMKQSQGFPRLWPTIITPGGMIVSFALLSWSMRVLPLGTAYSIWTGIGAVGALVIRIVFFGKGGCPMRIAAALLIIGGLILMKMSPA